MMRLNPIESAMKHRNVYIKNMRDMSSNPSRLNNFVSSSFAFFIYAHIARHYYTIIVQRNTIVRNIWRCNPARSCTRARVNIASLDSSVRIPAIAILREPHFKIAYHTAAGISRTLPIVALNFPTALYIH